MENYSKSLLLNNLAYYRKLRNLTQTQLAYEVGVSRNTISSLENRLYCPSLTLAIKISRCLNVCIESIWFYEPSRLVKNPHSNY